LIQGQGFELETLGVLLVELSGLLSNTNVRSDIDRLHGVIEELLASPKRKRSPRKLQPPQGQILKTIKLVMMEHPDGLHTYEVRQLIEEQLGRKLPKSTVKNALATNPAFERIGYGKYHLTAECL
jgi:hypothetical protein